jgi:chromosome segregation ATPase
MDQVLQAIRELQEQVGKVQDQMTRFETNVNERFERFESRLDKLEAKMDILDENQRDTQDNVMTLVQENWDHKKDLQKVKRRVGMDLI